MDIQLVWKIDADGVINANMDVVRDTEFPMLPRFGVRMFLNDTLEQVEYCGIGPYESYCDKHRAGTYGRYRAKVSELHEDYIRPQENGSHCGCDYVKVSNEKWGLITLSENSFSFNASCYTQECLEQARHNYELEACDSVVLCVDYAQNGIGSNSCGPLPMEKYRLDDAAFTFAFSLMPYVV